MRKHYKHLSIEERENIAFLIAQGKSIRCIARSLDRQHTSISRELERYKKSVHLKDYAPHRAELHARKTKIRSARRKRLKSEEIIEYVRRRLHENWSPEQISVRMSMDEPRLRISHEAIYQYVYAVAPELIHLLPRRHRQRYKKRPWNRHQNLRVPNRTSINERPEVINQRLVFGHWESDSMMSKTSSATTAHVLVERKSRLVKVSKLQKNGPEEVKEAIIRRLATQPGTSRRSITYDNGPENRNHEVINKALNLESYFCHPYHSWEKGTVENTIGLVRRFIPKGSDLRWVSTRRLRHIENLLNNRPRKCLQYRTPREAYQALSGALAA